MSELQKKLAAVAWKLRDIRHLHYGLQRAEVARPRPASCPTCGHRLASPEPPHSDSWQFLMTMWARGRWRIWRADELMRLAEDEGLFRGSYGGRTRHGRLASFAKRVLAPMIGRPVRGLELRRWSSGPDARRYAVTDVDEPGEDEN